MTVSTTTLTLEEILGPELLDDLCDHFPGDVWRRSVGATAARKIRRLLPEQIATLVDRPGAAIRALGRTPDGRPRAVKVGDASDLTRRRSEGYSLFVDEAPLPSVEPLARSVDAALGLPPGACRPKTSLSGRGTGFPPHFDQYETLQIQLEGTKSWRLATVRGVRWPLHPHLGGAAPIEGLVEYADSDLTMPEDADTVLLKPGDVMLVPRGHWHATSASEEESLSLVLRCATPAWLHLLPQDRSAELIRHAAWREPAAYAWGRGPRADRARDHLSRLLESIDSPADAAQLLSNYTAE